MNLLGDSLICWVTLYVEDSYYSWKHSESFLPTRSVTCLQWDFFQSGRLYFYGPGTADNCWRECSELARTGRVPAAMVIGNQEILQIQDPSESERFENPRVCAATRSAQKGPDVTMALYKTLLTSSRTCAANSQLLMPGDNVVICDVHGHAGDHAVASCQLATDSSLCHLTHVLVKTKAKGSPQACEFIMKRLGSYMAGKWLKHEMRLCDQSGKTVAPPVISQALTDEDRAFLKECHVLDAYEGAQKWQWQVLTLVGSELKIDPVTLAAFAQGPPSIRCAIAAIEKKHEKYADILKGKVNATDMSNTTPEPTSDPRPDPVEVPPVTGELPVIESLEALKSAYTIKAETKSFDNKSISVLVSDGGHVFLLPKDSCSKVCLKFTVFLNVRPILCHMSCII